jgi:hypothetical protein
MAKWQRFALEIPKEYTPVEREAIANEIIEFIIERTREKKKDKNNKSFPSYSKKYKESLDFKIAGKSGSVDLTLSGEMLDSLELISHKNGKLIIGYDKSDTELNGKVEGNILGSYGGKPSDKKARDFLGIAENDLNKILKKFPIEEEKRDLSIKRAVEIVTVLEELEDQFEDFYD